MTSQIFHETSKVDERYIWHWFVSMGEEESRIRLNEVAKHHLGITLMTYARPEKDKDGNKRDILDILPQMELQAAANEKNPATKRIEFRRVGDGCLLICGLFPTRFERFGISSGEIEGTGISSYRSLSEEDEDERFRVLADCFTEMVDVLDKLRTKPTPIPELHLVKG